MTNCMCVQRGRGATLVEHVARRRAASMMHNCNHNTDMKAITCFMEKCKRYQTIHLDNLVPQEF